MIPPRLKNSANVRRRCRNESAAWFGLGLLGEQVAGDHQDVDALFSQISATLSTRRRRCSVRSDRRGGRSGANRRCAAVSSRSLSGSSRGPNGRSSANPTVAGQPRAGAAPSAASRPLGHPPETASSFRSAHGGNGIFASIGARKPGWTMSFSSPASGPPVPAPPGRGTSTRRRSIPVCRCDRRLARQSSRSPGDTRLASCWAPSRMMPCDLISAATRSIMSVIGSDPPFGAKRFSSSSVTDVPHAFDRAPDRFSTSCGGRPRRRTASPFRPSPRTDR